VQALAFYSTMLLVAAAWMIMLPALILARLAGVMHQDAAEGAGRRPWVPGVQVTLVRSGGDQ
jgi:hypothetical protein